MSNLSYKNLLINSKDITQLYQEKKIYKFFLVAILLIVIITATWFFYLNFRHRYYDTPNQDLFSYYGSEQNRWFRGDGTAQTHAIITLPILTLLLKDQSHFSIICFIQQFYLLSYSSVVLIKDEYFKLNLSEELYDISQNCGFIAIGLLSLIIVLEFLKFKFVKIHRIQILVFVLAVPLLVITLAISIYHVSEMSSRSTTSLLNLLLTRGPDVVDTILMFTSIIFLWVISFLNKWICYDLKIENKFIARTVEESDNDNPHSKYRMLQ